MRKRRTDSWDATLTDEQRDAVFQRATNGGFGWEDVAGWASEEFHCGKPSRTAFYAFLQDWRPEYVARRTEERVLARQALSEQRKNLGDMSADTIFHLETEANMLIGRGDILGGERLYAIAAKIRNDIRVQAEHQLKMAAEKRAGEQLEVHKREVEHKIRSSVERGLQALFEETAGNERAQQLVLQLHELVGGKAAA